ncbi:AraC family transcriptional regulator [Motiliproteus sp. MSK22-1]|uniref:AraC family transcriptional regulator n=1 Tax=Motiliproteus sp. MSK22-1 TaxID=1897630 RepID=UPI000975B75D|nr:AraC family transcriptional regulator [Motiliproteus sp. MSK22-1]OMH28361.1 AraC family transcriptional regulator [Motiliproteus sp. MSK22-1]
MNNKITVPTSYVHSLLKSLDSQGSGLQALLDAAEIDLRDFERDEFPASKYSKLYQKVMWMMRDESFGMPSGGRVPNGTFRMMCLCVIHCKTVGQAIQRCSEFYEICRGARIKPALETRGRYAQVMMSPVGPVPHEEFMEIINDSTEMAIRTALSVWHHYVCWLAGRRLELESVSFSFSKPANVSEYEVLFQAPVRFNQSDNLIKFSSTLLDLPIIQTEETLEGFLKTAPYQLLVMVDDDNSLKSRVQSIIGRDFSREMPSAESVAESLNMSVTTLRRRLQREDTSFQKIKDECRREAATNYLSCPELSNNDVAVLMGFDETSAFFRSFKKWTGMTPGDYRRSAL